MNQDHPLCTESASKDFLCRRVFQKAVMATPLDCILYMASIAIVQLLLVIK
jgi:hypothetical protein